MSKLIAIDFLDEVGSQELLPVIHNGSPLLQGSGWNSKKYFSQFYKDSTPFPAFVSIRKGEGVMYIPCVKGGLLAEEVFAKFLDDTNILEQMRHTWCDLRVEIEGFYKMMNEEYLNRVGQEELRDDLERLRDVTWSYNAMAFFSTGLDKDVCRSVLERKGSSLDEEFWTRGSQPIVPSFEKRHGWEIARHVTEQMSHSTLREMTQYFFASYEG